MAPRPDSRPSQPHASANHGALDHDLARRFHDVRRFTETLQAPLSPEDCQVQSMDDASPVKWHLAHTTWFFETFLLEAKLPDYAPFHPEFRVLYNSYYQTVGDQYPRPQRGLVSRPSLETILEYRAHVNRHMDRLFASGLADTPEVAGVVEVGIHHEQQHQELLLTDVKHLLSCNPLRPAYRDAVAAGGATSAGDAVAMGAPATSGNATAPAPASALRWHAFPEGLRRIGYDGDDFAYDNERPRHRAFLEAFDLASRLVTNGEYLEFMRHKGYETPELWLSDGWDTVQRLGWRAPLYWEQADGAWFHFTLNGRCPVRPEDPVTHVSYYEAEAFARWAGERLPTEAEWEVAAAAQTVEGNFVESGRLRPAPARAQSPAGLEDAPRQLYGDVWEWTRSQYSPYPGYRAPAGALGEYNGKFMCNQFVLRGGSCATSRTHMRAAYRNFFQPEKRWQFSGLRLARDAR